MALPKNEELIRTVLERAPWAMTTQEIDQIRGKKSSSRYLRGLVPRKEESAMELARLVEKEGFAWITERVTPRYAQKIKPKSGKPLFLYCLKKENYKMKIRAFLELPGYLRQKGRRLEDMGWFLVLRDVYNRGHIREADLKGYRRKDHNSLREHKETLGLSPERISIRRKLVYMKESERKVWDMFTSPKMLALWKNWAEKYRDAPVRVWPVEFYRPEDLEVKEGGIIRKA